ncbi:Glycoprotein-N-acetylgalactosamine 3-beta-galactosyltransferase 1 [Mizuhopecten yessoensis]|uniref:Glycoprotein-N-acetylgalactosamine 3-beta-galactosyltransferase 1 n=1 Tax=Mizuhopecten yessoensis TaxID=6573 RepID=A0A210PGZ5_MIZYE|nr:Glycoprotein-N-acetylgalactosamine 3-beta-galactosyltransferase 1 [Mizuhopecten yessoensis]
MYVCRNVWLSMVLTIVYGAALLWMNLKYSHDSADILTRLSSRQTACVCPPTETTVNYKQREEQHQQEPGLWQEDSDASFHHDDDDTVARRLEQKVRVLCYIMTHPDNLDKKTIHVKNTWTKRCNKVLFISSVTNVTFPTVGVTDTEGRKHLTEKTMKAFEYIYEHHIDDADWFLKADDDTYVVLENLRHLLEPYSPNEPVYFGHHFKTLAKQGYHSGGAGYVLSKEALRRLVINGIPSGKCTLQGSEEDVFLGRCMQYVGVRTGNSTDSLGRSRFHCFKPWTHLRGGYPEWYLRYDANGAQYGQDSVSDYAISFHYVQPAFMYGYEYFVYHLRPYGIRMADDEYET